MPFKNVLFPVDFSERSCIIAPHVRALCERFNASLTLLHFVEVNSLAFVAPEAPIVFDFPEDELINRAKKRLDDFAATSFPGVPVKTVVDEGDPGACIAELAREWDVDLIMLPTRGCGRFRAALLGSVTAKTLHDASCAVWTEAHLEDGQATAASATDWKSVICAIDTDAEGLRLIRFAKELGASSGAKIRLAHAVTMADGGSGKYFELEFAAFSKDRASQAIAAMQAEAGTNFDVCMETGTIPHVVGHAALSHHADLVLAGRGLPHFAGRLRSHTYAIVRDMPCPVLSV